MSTCSRAYTINQANDFMPLSKAIYAADVDRIIGLFGNRVATFNPTTGARIGVSDPFFSPLYNLQDIAYGNGKIYVPIHLTPMDSVLYGGPGARHPWDIYEIDPISFAATCLNYSNAGVWAQYSADCAAGSAIYHYGPEKLFVTPTTPPYLCIYFAGWHRLYWIDLTNSANKGRSTTHQGANEGWTELSWSPNYDTDGGLFLSQSYDTSIEVWYELATPFDDYWQGDVAAYYTAPNNYPLPKGVCCRESLTDTPDDDLIYVTSGQRMVWKFSAVGGGSLPAPTTITLPVGAKPIVARYSSYEDLIYLPNWDTDEIFVINPAAADAVTTKTGFDCPIDVVCTPTKNWAVQNAVIALKEIV